MNAPQFHHFARRLARWVLALMLLAALAPAISRALVPSQNSEGEWLELCTSQGTQAVFVARDGAHDPGPGEPAGVHLLDHCGHCSLAAERFAPLIPSLPVLAVLGGHRPLCSWTVQGWASQAAPRAAARGPPLLN